MAKLNLAGLSKFGINLDSEIEGMIVVDAKAASNRKNVFQLQLSDKEGKKKKTVIVGAKSIDNDGLLEEADGIVSIAKGFETFTNAAGEVWVRNKNTATTKLEF